MSNLIPFNFEEKQIRLIADEFGDPWFVAKDVCDILGHSNHKMAILGLDDDEKGVRKVYSLGGEQETAVISESGLYTLIIRSNKPEAKRFRKWITSEVLPAIRKTGSFNLNDSQDRDYSKMQRDFKAIYGVASLIFPDNNQALVATNNMLKRERGFDWLEKLGSMKLIAPVQERYLTVTELAKQTNKSAVQLNKELEKVGLQKSSRDHKNRLVWEATEEGQKHSVLTDTGKKHGNGKPVQQLHWYPSVLEQLKQLSTSH